MDLRATAEEMTLSPSLELVGRGEIVVDARTWVGSTDGRGFGNVAIALLTSAIIGCGLVKPRPVPLARNCAEWSRLVADERLQTAEAFVAPELLANARQRQHLLPETADGEVFAAVGSSFDKVCELERRPALMLTEIVASLYR